MCPTESERRLIVTVDVEEDINTYLTDSYLGIREGLPWLLDFLSDIGIRACFFLLGHVCRRFPELMSQIRDEGHQIGCHGYTHDTLYYRTVRWQRSKLGLATRVVEETVGTQPRLFRAPRFSATARTIRVLEQLGYGLDSSILPDSKATMFRGRIPIRSTFGAPREPYYPDRHNIVRTGSSSVLEVPVTVSPLFPGTPISMGGLNTFGSGPLAAALDQVQTRDVIFLIHPWECVSLGDRYPSLKDWVKKLCAPNRVGLHDFLSQAERAFQPGNFGPPATWTPQGNPE